MRSYSGQGATEYLVLLAVVLIVALVSVALLGFFPSMASDAQITQSQAYWRSTSPIAIVDIGWAWKYTSLCWTSFDCGGMYMKIRNTGMYPIRLSKALGGDNDYASYYYNIDISGSQGYGNITLAPGEETCLGNTNYPGAVASRCGAHTIFFIPTTQSRTGGYDISAAKTLCNADQTGTMVITNFGFEYVEIIEGQEITKKFIGAKDLIVKCTG